MAIERNAQFYHATIEGDAWFDRANIGSLTFVKTIFGKAKTQENACRAAKVTQERNGYRDLADYHYYREMEAKRKQKRLLVKLLELPIQYIFGYGVKPFRLITWWLCVVIALALAYWLGNGVLEATTFWEHLYFSVTTSATPGYGGYDPKPGLYQNLATLQAIFGTFMWAAFIATFARKFMR
ncbi:ion channel [Chloroflexota bacterium]